MEGSKAPPASNTPTTVPDSVYFPENHYPASLDTVTAVTTVNTTKNNNSNTLEAPPKPDFQKVKNLLEFHIRDTMKVDSTYKAILAMAKDISSTELYVKIERDVDRDAKKMVMDTTQEIKTKMRAKLEDNTSSADPSFSIKLLGGESEVRSFDTAKNKMIWQWNVTPLKAGVHDLVLSVTEVDTNEKIVGSPETKTYTIQIVSEKKGKNFFQKIGHFIGNYWQFLIGAILIPLLVVYLSRRNKK